MALSVKGFANTFYLWEICPVQSGPKHYTPLTHLRCPHLSAACTCKVSLLDSVEVNSVVDDIPPVYTVTLSSNVKVPKNERPYMVSFLFSSERAAWSTSARMTGLSSAQDNVRLRVRGGADGCTRLQHVGSYLWFYKGTCHADTDPEHSEELRTEAVRSPSLAYSHHLSTDPALRELLRLAPTSSPRRSLPSFRSHLPVESL